MSQGDSHSQMNPNPSDIQTAPAKSQRCFQRPGLKVSCLSVWTGSASHRAVMGNSQRLWFLFKMFFWRQMAIFACLFQLFVRRMMGQDVMDEERRVHVVAERALAFKWLQEPMQGSPSALIALDPVLRYVWFAADDSVTMSVVPRRRSANDESKGRRGYLPYCAPMLKTEARTVVGVTTISRAVPLVLVVPSVSLRPPITSPRIITMLFFPQSIARVCTHTELNHAGGLALIFSVGATNDELGRIAWTSVGNQIPNSVAGRSRPC